MDDLIDLARLISKQKIKKIEVIGNITKKNSKLNQLYEGIVKGKFNSAEEAALHLYEGDPSNPNFKKLKNRLEDRLINTLLFIDVNNPRFKDSEKAFYYGQRALSSVNLLLRFGLRGPAMNMAEKMIKRAIQFEQTEIVVSLASRLSRHYGTMMGDLKKYQYYRSVTKSWFKIYEAEILAYDYYNELAIYNLKSFDFNEELQNQSVQYSIELKSFFKKYKYLQFFTF